MWCGYGECGTPWLHIFFKTSSISCGVISPYSLTSISQNYTNNIHVQNSLKIFSRKLYSRYCLSLKTPVPYLNFGYPGGFFGSKKKRIRIVRVQIHNLYLSIMESKTFNSAKYGKITITRQLKQSNNWFFTNRIITRDEALIIQGKMNYHPAGYGLYDFKVDNDNGTSWKCSNSCD